MKDASQSGGEDGPAEKGPRKRRKLLIIVPAAVVVILAGAGAAYFFVPGASDAVGRLTDRRPASANAAQQMRAPVFVELPEMAVTLPNGGRPRQMRIKLALELTTALPEAQSAEILSPRVFDALLTYLRTLRDGEVEGGLALDRMRGDLYRRLTLVLGPGTLRDVLITSLVVA